MQKKGTGKKAYANPKVDSLTVKQLEEAIGPVQGLSSGLPSGVNPAKTKKGRGGHGHGHGRGPR